MITHTLFSSSLILATIGALMIIASGVIDSSNNPKNIYRTIDPVAIFANNGILVKGHIHHC